MLMPVLHPAEIWKRSGPLRHRRRVQAAATAPSRDLVLAMTHEEIIALHAVADDPQLPRPAADLVPHPDQGAGRAALAGRRAAHARVHHEGLLHARPRPGRPRRGLREARGGLRPHLHPLRPRLLQGRVRHRDHGRSLGATSTWRPRAPGEDRVARCSTLRLRRERRDGRLARRVAGRRRRARRSRRSRRRTWRLSRSWRSSSASTRARPARRCPSCAADGKLWLALVRGDRRLHELKLSKALGRRRTGPPRPTRSRRRSAPSRARSAPVGIRAGAIGGIIADETLREGSWVTGANRTGWHLTGVELGRDFEARVRRHARGRGRRQLPVLRRRAADRADDRDRQHLQARHALQRGDGRDVPRRERATSSRS